MRKDIFTLFILLLSGLLASGCEDTGCTCFCSDYNAEELILNDTLDLKYSELYCNPDYEIQLSFDSLTDTRCPIGVICIWEGNASVRLNVQVKGNDSMAFSLNTNDKFLTDTVVNGLRYELIDVLPYPIVDKDYQLDDYILQLHISD